MITSYQYEFTAPPHHYRYIEWAKRQESGSGENIGSKFSILGRVYGTQQQETLSEVLNQNIEIEADQV